MGWREGYAALLQPSLRYQIDQEGAFRARGSSALVGALLIAPMVLLLLWALTIGGSGGWTVAVLYCVGAAPFALFALLQRVEITIDPSRIRYTRGGLKTRTIVVSRSALRGVSLTKRVFQAESRFVVYHAELRFDDERMPSRVKVFESTNFTKAKGAAERLSEALSCPTNYQEAL